MSWKTINSNNKYLEKWAECYGDIIWIDNVPWHEHNKVLSPLQLPHNNLSVNKLKLADALARSKSLLAHWTDKWDRSESEWWWICCDNKQYAVDKIESSRGRRGIRKGLEYCEVRKINHEEFSDLAYNIYAKSLESYGVKKNRIYTKDKYNNYIKRLSNYHGYELWGSFVKNKLSAFAACVVLNDAVLLGSTKSDPEMHKFNVNNALFFIITKYYLSTNNIQYITNGHRTLVHDTTIDEFLIRLGYRKVYCRLNLELSKSAKIFNSIGSLIPRKNLSSMMRIFPSLSPKVGGFTKLVEIHKTFKEE